MLESENLPFWEPAMTILRPSCVAPHLSFLLRGLLPLVLVWGALCSNAFGQGQVSVPSQPYFLSLATLYNGQYVATDQTMVTCLGGAIKNPAAGGFWIDSICYETIRGECAYQMGNHAAAMAHYAAAIQLLINFNAWMLAVQFPPAIAPAPPQQLKPIPWYVTTRQTVVGGYPLQMNIQQGNINNNAAIVQGGIVQQAMLVPIYAQEIVRCSCLAIRRWREVLGPACPHHKLTQQLVQVLGNRPTWPNHWSEAWIDTELGLAYAAAGKTEQARKTLSQAERASGLYDHAFTGTTLLMRGILDLEGGNYRDAHRDFLEASWAAANFNDFGVVEESLRYASLAHFLEKGREPYPLLAPATGWATAGSLSQLEASLLLDSAENQSLCGVPAAAATTLGQVTVLTSGSNMPAGKIGARLNHLKALVAYQMGQTDVGDVALAAAMTFQSVGSLRMYHIAFVDGLWLADSISERNAVDLYTRLLSDPTPSDWLIDPLESLSVLFVPHPLSYEHWFEAALARKNKEHELALQIADMAKRHRFLTTLDHGGRLLNLRWLLEAPESVLDNNALMQRQALLARFPLYQQKSDAVRKLRGELRKLPLSTDDLAVAEQQAKMLTELATLSGEQEKILREMSAGREPANLVFPPLRSFKQVQESLAEGQSLLVFFDTSKYTYSFLLAKDKYNYTEVKPPKNFSKNVSLMLQKWGNFEQNKQMKLEELISSAWQGPAQQIMTVLVKNSKADFTKTLDELVIVPDGILWYVPFEALPAPGDDKRPPLIDKLRIRYAPTIGLAVGETRRRKPKGNLAVALGRLYPADDPALIDREYEDLARAFPDAEAIRGKLPCHGAIYSSLFDRLIVLNEVPPSHGYDWSPLQIDNKMSGGTLSQWLSLPFDGPDQVILPAFRTPAERGLSRKAAGADGSELFLSVCGLMAGGARTVLISRWRTGGQTSIDLVREFAQELPHTTASDAWQRSVQVLRHSQVHPLAEPRLKLTTTQEPPDASHPFFWAGYLLADTGALPVTGDEDEAADQVVAVKPVDDKPADDEEPAQPKAQGKVMDEDPDPPGRKPGNNKNAGRQPIGQNAGGPAKVDAAGAPPQAPQGDAAEELPSKAAKPKRVRPPRADQKQATGKVKRSAA
jgi:tetratricopeptide (TPR) repeat protein